MTEKKYLSGKMTALNAAVIYTIGAFLIQGINFITLPIFAALMSPEDFGIYTSYENWTAIITVIIGLQTTASIANAYIDYTEDRISAYVSSISIIGWISLVFISSFTLILKQLLSEIFELGVTALFFGIIQCFFSYFLTLLMNEYRIINKPIQYLVFSCLNTSLTIMGGILFINIVPMNSYIGRISGTMIAACITGIVAMFIIYRKSKLTVNYNNVKYALILSLPLIFHAFAGIIMGKTDQMMLLKMTTASEMGIYSYGNKIGHVIYVLYTAINQAFVPWYYKKRSKNELPSLKKTISIYVNLFFVFTICILLILPEAIQLISPPTYYGAIYTAPLIIAAFYMNFLYAFPVNYEFYNKKTGYVAIGTIGSALINIILNIVLIPLFDGRGAAFATIISYVTLLFIHLFIVNKIIKEYEIKTSFFVIRIIFMSLAVMFYFVLLDMMFVRWNLLFILTIIFLRYIFINYKKKSKGVIR